MPEMPALLISYLVPVIIIWLALILGSRFVAHEFQAKRSLLLAVLVFLSYFIVPLIFSMTAINLPFAGIIVPLVVWIILSELLLRQASFGGRIKIAVVAFVIYLILIQFVGLPGIIAGFLGQ